MNRTRAGEPRMPPLWPSGTDECLTKPCRSGVCQESACMLPGRHATPPRTPPHEGDGPDEYPRPCHGDGEPACSARAACTEEAVQARSEERRVGQENSTR